MASQTPREELYSRTEIASYSHCPINAKTEIRILELSPPALSDPSILYCDLIAAKLIEKPSYEALSYTWGEAVFPERLHLPSGYLAITYNLAAALRQLRHPDRPRRLWVDAVCINQQDDTEKGYQISLMSQIYGKTDRALAWLGEGNQQTQAAIRILWGLSTSAWKYGINTARPLFANLLHRPDEDIKKAMRVLLLRSTATTTYEAEVIS